MTIEEFNENYSILVLLQASQTAVLKNNVDELEYTENPQPIANTTYQVFDKSWKLQLEVMTEDDGIFIEALLNKFKIKELK